MPFVVRADSGKPEEGTFRADKVSREDALETAIGLLGQGMTRVTITDDAGHIYTTLQLSQAIEEDT